MVKLNNLPLSECQTRPAATGGARPARNEAAEDPGPVNIYVYIYIYI